ncbi:MAG: hypothetical protein KBC91_01540 [Candidatus Omnitrophica bacterium]|nr:hypothetical protein [Candidatus Omnitrophota bacterium]
MPKTLKKLPSSKLVIFKIKNRRGYAGILLNNLTEGKTPAEVFARMAKAVKREGFELSGAVPSPKS